jgi:hypothetical protein
MALTLKDRETEQLAAEIAAMTGESKTSAVKIALQERKATAGDAGHVKQVVQPAPDLRGGVTATDSGVSTVQPLETPQPFRRPQLAWKGCGKAEKRSAVRCRCLPGRNRPDRS